jgi:hypothetical protein
MLQALKEFIYEQADEFLEALDIDDYTEPKAKHTNWANIAFMDVPALSRLLSPSPLV